MKVIEINGMKIYYWTAHVPCWIQGTIVDIETTGFEPDEDQLTALGLVKDDRLSVFVRDLKTSDEDFRSWSRNKLIRCSRPFIAYYKDFEEKWLNTPFDIEIQPRSHHKKVYAIEIQHLNHGEDGSYLPDYFFSEKYAKIAWHCANDLFEELGLYISLSHDYRKYRHPIKEILSFGKVD